MFSSFEPVKACGEDKSIWESRCEQVTVPLLRCEALWAFGKPEYIKVCMHCMGVVNTSTSKVDIEERHYACIRALQNLPPSLLPKYVSWEMHEHAFGMPYPLMDTKLMIMLWELGYEDIKVVAQVCWC